jgi:hypothetical protein
MIIQNNPYGRQRLIQFETVDDPARWPKADSGKCFVLEAVNLAGCAMFGPGWTGQELRACKWATSPAVVEHAPEVITPLVPLQRVPRSIANIGLIEPATRNVRRQQHGAHVKAYHLFKYGPLIEQARADAEEQWLADRAAFARLTESVDWLAQRSRDNEVKTYARRVSGGELYPMLASEWNVDAVLERFVSNGGFKRYFIDGVVADGAYIFFDRADLAHASAMLVHATLPVAGSDLSRLSPYLQFAIKLAFANGYTSDGQIDKNAVREALIRDAWPEALPDIPISQAKVEMIAGIVGFPNAIATQRGQRGGSVRKSRVTL